MYILYAHIIDIVPVPHVKISIPEFETFIDYETSGDVSSGESGERMPLNVTIGDPLTLDCTITAVRGISSLVSVIWTTGDIELRRVDNITADIVNDSAVYTNSFEISSLSAIDNGREYQCRVMINATQPVNSSDQFTPIFSGEHNSIVSLRTYVHTTTINIQAGKIYVHLCMLYTGHVN